MGRRENQSWKVCEEQAGLANELVTECHTGIQELGAGGKSSGEDEKRQLLMSLRNQQNLEITHWCTAEITVTLA